VRAYNRVGLKYRTRSLILFRTIFSSADYRCADCPLAGMPTLVKTLKTVVWKTVHQSPQRVKTVWKFYQKSNTSHPKADDVSSDRSYRRIVWAAVFPSTCSSVDDDPTTLAPPCTIFILRELARAHTLIYIPIYCTRETFFFFQYFFFFLF